MTTTSTRNMMATTRSRLTFGASGASSTPRTSNSRLPEYEPAQFAMTPEAQQRLDRLYAKHDFKKLQGSLVSAINTLTDSAADINERHVACRLRIEKQKSRKRKHASDDPVSDDKDDSATNEEYLEELGTKVESMTKRMDLSMRKVIDNQEALELVRETLSETTRNARANANTQATVEARSTQRRGVRENGIADGEDEDQYPDITPTDPSGPLEQYDGPSLFYKQNFEHKKTLYQTRSLIDRYGGNEHYKSFRGLIHVAQYPDESVAQPPVESWFEEGVLARPGMTQRGDEDDEDEDIQISRATTSTKCPITLREFEDPITARQCQHTFEAQAINEMIQANRQTFSVRCPVQSCESVLSMSDLYRDPVIIRKIQRLQQARTIQDDEIDDSTNLQGRAQSIHSDDDALDIDQIESDDLPPRATQFKKEHRSGLRRA